MDVAALTAAEADELRALRARAYGPRSDIAADADAQRRLDGLERRARAVVEPAATGGGESDEQNGVDATRAVTDGVVEDPTGRPVQESDAGAESTPPMHTRPRRLGAWLRRHPVVVGAASALTVLALGAVALGAMQPQPTRSMTPTSGDSGVAESLDAQGITEALNFSNPSLVEYGTHRGAQVWTFETEDGRRCLGLGGGQEGIGFYGLNCVPVGLDPRVDLTVWPGMELGDFGDLPANSVIRFELHGDRVDVFEALTAEAA